MFRRGRTAQTLHLFWKQKAWRTSGAQLLQRICKWHDIVRKTPKWKGAVHRRFWFRHVCSSEHSLFLTFFKTVVDCFGCSKRAFMRIEKSKCTYLQLWSALSSSCEVRWSYQDHEDAVATDTVFVMHSNYALNWDLLVRTLTCYIAGVANPRLASRMRLLPGFMRLLRNYQTSHRITCITINCLQSSVIVMLVCDIYNKSSWAKVWVRVRKRWVMFMCVHVYDVVLCGNTVRNVALGLWLVGHPPL